ncbi:regulatory protein, luxR family [Flavobacterium fluvii]|uniref:Regulatory protein, luxR family n=1 Tax=Flavobacterium fluvii TaxID=468056 RepID=A0A1M5KED7_9FLAO|nr:helix-turn-helix transcriptional regulator [Flavobacterium fluvii]SHG51091.1 regulatory protein, luxR family [Flavobacterium fluvii]
MKNCLNKLCAIAERLFPDQVKVFDISSLDIKKADDSMLNQTFFEPLSEESQQELARQIAGFLNKEDEETVYSFFWGNNETENLEAKWYVSSARLKKSENGTFQKIVIFTYDLELIGDCKEKIYKVMEDLDFLKNIYNKLGLLTKRETEILELLAMGRTNIEISVKLYISEHTVNTHRKNINRKLEIRTLAELMKYAVVFDMSTS